MMQDIWLPSSEGKDSRIVGRFRDIEDTYTDREGNKKTRVVTILEHKVPGSSDISSSIVKPFNKDELTRRFNTAWELYEKHKAASVNAPPEVPLATQLQIKGMPIETVNFLGKDKIGYLKSQGFLTVEQLANMSDADCQNIGFGAKKWRKQAAEHLVSPTNPN